MTCLTSYCSSSLTFHTQKTTQVASFPEYLMIRLLAKPDKPYTTMMALYCTTP